MDFEREWDVNAAADQHQQPLHLEAEALRSHANAAHGKGVHAKPVHPHAHTGPVEVVVPNAEGVVVLPAGTDINDIEVSGRNLIVTLPDGTQMVIQDGAVVVPHIVIGDVEIPTVNLAALLIGEEPQPAAGPPSSSGGNFLAPDGNVGDPHGLGDLLPPTELNFTQPEQREIIPFLPTEDHQPEVVIVTPDQPAGATNATAEVSEAGLGAREGEPAGSDSESDSEHTSGTIVFSAEDGLAGITINGQTINLTGAGDQFVDTPLGRLTITSIENGVISYTYTLNDNVVGPPPPEVFTVVVTDSDGDKATATLSISIADDVPHALNDTDSLAAGNYGPETGNVITGAGTVSGAAGADIPGADGIDPAHQGGIAGVAAGANGSPVEASATVGAEIDGLYGKLLISANGDYSYSRNPGTPGGVTDSFTYTLRDGDGDLSSATLTISIGDSTPSVVTPAAGGETTTVYEAGLPARGGESEGSGEQAAPGPNGDPREAVSGTVTFHSGDGIASLTVGGVALDPDLFPQTVVNNGTGTLVITGGTYDAVTGDGSFTYTYTLTDNTSGDHTSVSFEVVLTDQDGDPASSNLTINIVDDVPQAIDDIGYTVTEDGAVNTLSGNVLTNDVSGADTPKGFVGWGGAADAATVTALNTYGTLTQNGDGTWSYVLDNSRAATQALGASFSQDYVLHYTMQDGDGDPSSATLTITVKGAADGASVVTAALNGPDNTVYEAGLPSGSLHDGSHVATGSFTVSATDGIANIVVGGTTFTLAQMQGFTAGTPGVVDTGEGTLRLTGYAAGTGVVSYSYTLKAALPNGTYPGSTGTSFDDSVHVTVNGIGGTTAGDDLVVRIVDDTPTAVTDPGGTVTEDGALNTLSGNVLTNDVSGADTPKGFVGWGGAADAATVTALNTYGTLTQNGDGTWSYVLDNSRAATQALGASFSQDYVLHYTMQDGDGDPSSATLTITVKGAADGASVVTAALNGPDNTVYEAGLPSGSLHDGSHVATGSFTVSATDGIANIVVGGTTFTLAQMQGFTAGTPGVVDTGEGTLRLTGYAAGTGGVSYSYTLKAALPNGSYPGSTGTSFDDSVHVTVNGIGGTTAGDDLVVRIVDDTPTAVSDIGGTVTEDGAVNTLSGNVLTNDVSGADTPKGFVGWGGAADAATVTALNTYGTLTQNGDGTWSYVLDNSRAATQALGASFSQDYVLHYTMQDGDGDPSSATLVITVKGAADGASVVTAALNGPDNTVYEAGLPSGSLHDGSHVATGSFTVSATDGIATIVVGGTTFTLAQMQGFTAGTPGVVDTGEGTLRLTGYAAGTGVVSYSYTLKAALPNGSYPGSTGTSFDDSVHVTVNGIGGTTAGDDLVVRIVDDTPTLGPVQSQQTDNNAATTPAIGTLHYTSGADGVGSSMTITANTTGITSGGHNLVTEQVGNVLTAYADIDGSGTHNAGDTAVFTITVDPAAGTSGQYVFDLLAPLDGVTTPVTIGSGSSSGSGPTQYVVVSNVVMATGWTPTGSFNEASWLTGVDPSLTQTGGVNGSTAGWGLGNNNLDAGEFMRFDFGALNDYDGAGPYTSPAGVTLQNATYATFTFANFGSGDKVEFVAHYTNGSTASFTPLTSATSLTITAPGGTQLAWIDVYESTGSIKLNLTEVGVTSTTVDRTIPVTLQLSDGDNDTTSAANFTIHVKDGLLPNQPAAPVALDLNGNGLEFVGLSAGVHHDYGAGEVNTAWVAPSDGLLAHAVGGSYDIVFSDDAAGAKSDLDGLRLAYDSNGDGILNAKDAHFAEFGVWQDLNSNGHVDAGEFKSLAAAGITSISLTANGVSYAATNGDVTVLGEASFTRTDGSTGTVGDAVFTTAPKSSATSTTDSTTSGFNQALVAASLVAVAGATETVTQEQPAPAHTETALLTDTAPASTTVSEPTQAAESNSTTLASTQEQDGHTADKPVEQGSHAAEQPAPDHASLSGGEDTHAAPVQTTEAPQPVLDDHQGLLAQSISLPAFDGSAAMLALKDAAAPNAAVAAEVVNEALGAHGGPDIHALLAALPGGAGHVDAPILLNPMAGEAVDSGHLAAFASGAGGVIEAAMAMHEAMAVAHA